ncbi:MAG TPA: diaminobutyrate--2-oxoglutarate transaminase family protein [Actinopolymorphaceae bacterium]
MSPLLDVARPGATTRHPQRESSARTYARNLPIEPVHASGTTITAADGRTYLDCLSGAGALALGHNHPVAVEAIHRALTSGAPMTTLDLDTPLRRAFTETLFALLPPRLAERGRIHFCGPTGADAVEAALKLSRIATGRTGLLAFTGAYHGMTSGALAATGNVAVRSSQPLADLVTRLPFPYGYRCPFGAGGSDGATLSACYVERLLADPNGGITTPAAMILEPVQGEGGVVPAPTEWLRSMRAVTKQHDIVLVADEVQTGVGRTGTFWAVDRAGVTPDVLVLSKAIGGGLPLAVIVYDGELDRWPSGAHTGTFRGNQLAMAAGAATLRFVAENDLPARADDLGARLRADLTGFAARHPSVGEVRGRGLMIGIEAVDPSLPQDSIGAYPAHPELARRVRAECLHRGLIVELGGRLDTVVRLLPPLTITDQEADAVLERLCEAWEAAEAAEVSRS